MEIFIFDKELNLVGILPYYKSFTWKEFYREKGLFSLTISDTAEGAKTLKTGYYLYQKNKDTLMIIRYVKYNSTENEIIVRGYSALDLLEQRYIEGTVFIENAEAGMYDMVLKNLRGLPIGISAAEGFTEEFKTHYTGKQLLERLNQIAVGAGLGIKMVFEPKSKTLMFKVYKGVDRTSVSEITPRAVFSEEFGNLANTVIVKDESVFKNFVLVAGGGTGEDRVFVTVGAGGEGLDRFELYVDARDLQQNEGESTENYRQRLVNRGVDKLNERIKVDTFIAEIDPSRFREMFGLGDLVSCKSVKYGVTVNTRIMAFEEVTEKNMTRIALTLGNPEISLKKEVELNIKE